MNPRRFLVSLVLIIPAGSCTDSISLGTEGPYWTADFETGDTSQWSPDAELKGGGGRLTTVSNLAHDGRYAMQASISPNNNRPSFARLGLVDVPQDAYFSIWMYIPARYTIDVYWNLFEFQGRRDATKPDAWSPVWSLNLHQDGPDPEGDMVWYVFHRKSTQSEELRPATPMAAPVGRWFQVRAFVHQATDDTGKVAFWIDDRLLVEAPDTPTVPTPGLLWAVGSASSGIIKAPAELFLDDAAIVLPP